MTNSIYLFQRALRIDDNLGLIQCLKESTNVYPVFCVDPRQATPDKNKYMSTFALGFMLQSLDDLQLQLKKVGSSLSILYGEPQIILKEFIEKYDIQCIYINRDYTPFAKTRAEELKLLTSVKEVDDYLLITPGNIVNKSGVPYQVYTPFMKHFEKIKNQILTPTNIKKNQWSKLKKIGMDNSKPLNVLKKNSKYSIDYNPAGRTEALKRLKNLNSSAANYNKCRDYLLYKTTNLSAYIKFGCISIREAWRAFDKIPGESGTMLKRQLIWREFYYHIYNTYPEKLEWDKDIDEVKLDKDAPDIVKACYNQLDTTGYLHNRGRMILAHYLMNHKKQYWKSCDKLYARRLVDYDPIVNSGNHLWILKQPKFKWLKPETQYKKFDSICPKKSGDNTPTTDLSYTKKYK